MARWCVGRRFGRGLLAGVAATTVCVVACRQEGGAAAPPALGVVDFGAPCDGTVVEEVDRGIALLHHMTYPGALAAFEDVMRWDPDCAVAYWGAAMTLFQPLWPTRPSPEDLRRGWDLSQEARRRAGDDERVTLFVATAEAFFDPTGAPDYWTRIERWAEATDALRRAHPNDRDARAFYALSLLATADTTVDPAARHAEAARILADILAEEPTHPGAVHYTIHANDFTGREHEGLDVVRSYSAIAPANPHALHMPTHVFVRLGAWDDVIDGNRRAADAALLQRVGPSGEYVWDEFPHAIEYLVYAELQKGDDDVARAWIDSLRGTPDLQPSFKTAFHLASTAARYAVERRAWDEAVALTPRTPATLDWAAFPWAEAVVWFARGLGAVHVGAEDIVRESLARLSALRGRAEEIGEPLFTAQIEILRLEVTAWQAVAGGDAAGAVERMEEAVRLEERTPKHPVTPGATLPARELLGDLHLAMGGAAAALEAYRASNERTPGRLNTLLGLARSSAALGDTASARTHYRAVVHAAVERSSRPGVEEARAYVR